MLVLLVDPFFIVMNSYKPNKNFGIMPAYLLYYEIVGNKEYKYIIIIA